MFISVNAMVQLCQLMFCLVKVERGEVELCRVM